LRRRIMVLAVWLMWTVAALAQETFGGRVVAGTETSGILVSLERQNGQIYAQVFTDSRGAFRFRDVGAGETIDNYVYLVVEHEGFKRYSQRLDRTDVQGGGVFTIYLESEDSSFVGGDTAVDLRQMLASIPEEAREEYEEALEDAEDGDHDDAAERLERVVELAPAFYDAWIDLGGQYDALGQFDDAKTAYEQAAEVDPNGSVAHLNLGALYYQEGARHAATENAIEAMGTFAEARVSLERAIELSPLSAEARFYLGATLYQLVLPVESETMLQSVLDIEPEHAQARLTLINLYARIQRYEDALEQADAFLEENDDAPESEAIERVKSQLEGALGR
jgi:tetratricopeptide (TPR) repeat protein